MSTRILAEIESSIDSFVQENCEEEDWPEFYVHPKLVQQMAQAAYAVFMASADGQEYAESQEGD